MTAGVGDSRIARNWLWSLAEEGLNLVAAMLSVLLLIPQLGPARYGAWVGLYALLGPFAAFAHSGVTLTILEHTVRNREAGPRVARSCMSLALAIACLLAPVVILLGSAWIRLVSVPMIALFVGNELVVVALLLSIITAVQGTRGYGIGVALRLCVQAIRMLVLVALVLADRVSIENLIVANAASIFGFAIVAYSLVAARFGLGPIRPGRIDLPHLRSTLTYALGISASITQNDGDKVVLNASGHQVDSGLYAAAYRSVSLVMVPISAFVASTHFAVLRSSVHASDQFRRALVFASVTAAYAIPAAGLLVLAAPLAPDLLGKAFRETTPILRLVAPILVVRSLGTFAMNGLLGLERNTLRTTLLVANAIASVVLYLLWIPSYSWRGAVAGTLVSETLLFTASWTALYLCQRRAAQGVEALT